MKEERWALTVVVAFEGDYVFIASVPADQSSKFTHGSVSSGRPSASVEAVSSAPDLCAY